MALSCMCNKNMQYDPYLWPNYENFHVLEEIAGEEPQHRGDVLNKLQCASL